MPDALSANPTRRIDSSNLPWAVAEWMHNDVGAAYGVSAAQKQELIRRFAENGQRIQTASHWLEHLVIATEILRLPPQMPGDVVEFGCFKGGSTANLSLACQLAGRRLVVCDSFAGLPQPADGETTPDLQFPLHRAKKSYTAGQYAGSLEEVRGNVAAHGCLQVCDFVPGYFQDSLPQLNHRVATAFIDVDLRTSLETCLAWLWPRMPQAAKIFSHEAQDMQFVALFFDEAWWQRNFQCAAPGFIGAGTGLPLGTVGPGSSLGYTVRKQRPAASTAPAVRPAAPPVERAAAPAPARPFHFDADRLQQVSDRAGTAFTQASPFPHLIIDNLLPPQLLESVLAEFPDPHQAKWKQCYHANSKKLSCADERLMGDTTRHVLAELNSGTFLSFLERLTGIRGLIPDPHLFGGGLHLIEPGGFLKIHADFNVHQQLRLDRRLNLLLFLNQNWREEYGGHLELWDRDMTACRQRILPVFNRCVIFATTDWAYHGHPEPLTCPPDRSRKSIAMYYYTNGRPAEEHSKPHSTLYQQPRTGVETSRRPQR